MQIVRFIDGKKTKYGLIQGTTVKCLRENPFSSFKRLNKSFHTDGNSYKLNDIKILAPCTPSKLVCVGGNHKTHAGRMGPRTIPLIFLKPSTSVIGTGDNVILPENSGKVAYEGELAAVIGKTAKDISEANVSEFVLGYTIHNDIGDLSCIPADEGVHTRGKGFDTFSPLGPCIETDLDPDNVKIETFLNGDLVQSDSTSGLLVSVHKLISFISRVMTLLPGDIVSTGTPAKLGRDKLEAGDVIKVKIDKIGTLVNQVKRKN